MSDTIDSLTRRSKGAQMTSVFTESQPLPPYRAVLAVDAKDFTKTPGSTHEDLSAAIRTVAGLALRDAGLEAEWSSPDFRNDAGDGFAVGFPSRVLPFLLHPFPAHLQRHLSEYRRAHPGEAPLRLRVSVHVGPLPADPAAIHATGNGDTRNDTHRLLDSDAVREALRNASPEISLVAMVVSGRVFDDVVHAGYAGLHPDHFVPVTARVKGKDFDQAAWLHLPAQPGRLIRGEAAPADSIGEGRSVSGPGPSIVNHGQAAMTNHGGMHMDRRG